MAVRYQQCVLLTVVVCVLGTTVGILTARDLVVPQETKGFLKVDDGSLTFESDGSSLVVPVDVRVFNDGPEPIAIDSVRPACGCTVASFPRSILGVDEHATIRLAIDLRKLNRNSQVVDHESGRLHVGTAVDVVGRFMTPSGRGRYRFSVRGSVALPVRAGMDAFALGEVNVRTAPFTSEFTISLSPDVVSVDVDSPVSGIDATVSREGMDGNATVRVTVTPSTLVRADANHQRQPPYLRFFSRAADNRSLFPVTVPVSVSLIPDIVCSPPRVLLGPLSPGESASRQISVRPHPGVSLSNVRIVDTPASASGIEATLFTADDQEHRIEVVANGARTGMYTGVIRVEASLTDAPDVIVDSVIPLSVYTRQQSGGRSR